jgi:predicted metalloprotease with PDZ domain
VFEEEVEELAEEICGAKLADFFATYVHGTSDIPLAKLLADFGVSYSDERAKKKPSLEVQLAKDGNDCKLATVFEGGAAHQAGLSGGDILLAIDGLRVVNGGSNVATLLGRYKVGNKVELHVFRRDELLKFTAVLGSDDTPAVKLGLLEPGKKKSKKEFLLRPSAV